MREPIRIELSLGFMFQTVNCYLVPGEPLTLVDCGLDSPENWEIFQKKIAEHGFSVGDIEQVLITHEHRDHIGLLPKILEHSRAAVRAPKAIEGWFSRPMEMKASLLAFIRQLYPMLGLPKETQEKGIAFLEKIGAHPKIEELDRFIFFEEGDMLQMGNTEWEALNTPGHCPAQFVFLQKKERRIFGGDMLLPLAPMPIVSEDPTRPGQPNRALIELLGSFDRLKAFDIKTVYPGHGDVFADANEVIENQLARIQMRKEECWRLYNSGLKTVYEIHQRMYPYHQLPPNFSGIHMIIGYLDLLQAESLIENDYAIFWT